MPAIADYEEKNDNDLIGNRSFKTQQLTADGSKCKIILYT